MVESSMSNLRLDDQRNKDTAGNEIIVETNTAVVKTVEYAN
jgi:hypothetical protein